MKLNRIILTMAAIASIVASCSKPEPIPTPKPTPETDDVVFTVSGGTVEVPSNGGEVNVKVEYSEAYTVGILPSWVTVGTKATKTDNLTFIVAANTTDAIRQADIIFTSNSGKTGKVTIKQAFGDPPLPATTALTTAKWEINNSGVSAGTSKWTGSNMVMATGGSAANKAYFSLEAGGTTKPQAVVYDNKYCAVNLNTNDAIVFTQPNTTLAAGSTVDFMLTIWTPSTAAPKYWICEIYDGGEWKAVEEDLKTATENSQLKYSFYIKYFSSACYTTFVQNFTTTKDIRNGDLKVRCRVVGNYNNAGGTLSPSSSAYVGIMKQYYQGAAFNSYQGIPVKDTKKVLVLGNSFTYYYSAPFILKEIARSQGHEMRMRANIKGSQYFRNHSSLELSQLAVKEGGYDFAILQDQSGQHALYYSNVTTNAAVLNETKTLVDQIKSYSPAVNPIVENTWAFLGSSSYEGYGSMETFDKALQGGALLICDALDVWMSPVGIAFQKARAAGITDLYHTDNKHPNRNGAYLKACVNYLLMYGEKFDANVPDCLVSASTAKKLRDIAEEVVLGNEATYRNPDASKVVPGEGIGEGGGTSGGGELDPDAVVPGENGIKTADQLISFAYVFNNGGDISSYKNADGEVALLDDIDLGGALWTPVGTSTGVALAYNASAIPSYPFKDKFNGNGHTVSNFRLAISDNQTNVTGFFGAANGATIKNFTLKDVSVSFNSTGISSNNVAMGTVLGYCYNSVVENVNVTAEFTGTATSTSDRSVAIGGIVGTATATSSHASKIQNCTFSGSMTNDIGTKYSNSNTASISGIVGIVTNKGSLVLIKGCTNKATINVKSHRAAGIVSAGFYTNIEDCVNEGDITCNYSASRSGTLTGVRMGGIMAYCSHTSTNSSYIKNCVNSGNITTTQAGSAAGGIVGLMRTYTVTGSTNTGNVIGPVGDSCYRGLLVGAITNATDPSTITDCYLCGKVGTKADGSDLEAATAENYLNPGIGITIASDANCPSWNATNVHFYTGK